MKSTHAHRIVITGGGTGGHIVPGLALAETLITRNPEAQILWIGASGRKEQDLVPRRGIPFLPVAAKSLRRGGGIAAVRAAADTLFTTARGFFQAFRALRRFRPQVVLGMGGYVCFPVIAAAWFRRVPSIICEQNSVPGLTVKLLSKLVDYVAVTYAETERLLSRECNIEVTGNPVDARLLDYDCEQARRELELPLDRNILLVLGGSLGAEPLNRAVIGAVTAERWRADLSHNWFILHSTGPDKIEAVLNATREAPSYRAEPFIYENYKALAAATAAVTRAGATTIAEICARGLPALLIPWPGAAHDHQTKNAEFLKQAGAAETIPDARFSAEGLLEFVARLDGDPHLRQSMSESARRLATPEAARKICELVDELAADAK